MNDHPISLSERLAALPPEWSADPRPAITAALATQPRTLVVLDDDPTGTQTVHSLPVLTSWAIEQLAAELASNTPAFYLLTNSRSLPPSEAQALTTRIGRNLRAAAVQTGRRITVVSRSDSTLRGHFPGEVQALDDALGGGFDAWLIVPFFQEGGRYTIDDIHYVADGDLLVPAGMTEFARDPAFGYRASNLREWVAEKTGGRVPADRVASIGLDDLRRGGPERVVQRLLELPRGAVCIANAAARRDIEVLVNALLNCEGRGRRYLYRTAASFVPPAAGIEPRPLLTQADLGLPSTGGGLIMVGSFVPRTTSQVEALINHCRLTPIELDVAALIDGEQHDREVARVAALADERLGRGLDTLVMTSRTLVAGTGGADSLAIGARISEGLCAVLRRITTRPRYLIAKGGITSSDLATSGLGVQRAMVLGQALPGVPVWRLGSESRLPGLAYIVFPGNVGSADALATLVERLRA